MIMHQRQSTHVHFFLFAMCMQYDVRTVLVPRAVQEPYKVMETKMVAIQVGCCVLSCSCCVAQHALLCLCLCLLLVHGHVSVQHISSVICYWREVSSVNT